jgi:hypothetical protein
VTRRNSPDLNRKPTDLRPLGYARCGTFGEPSSAKLAQPAGTQWSGMHSAERLCGGGDDLIVWHVAQVLSDVPAMPERVLKLAMPVTPEHLRQRLTDLCARRHRLREHHLSRVCPSLRIVT